MEIFESILDTVSGWIWDTSLATFGINIPWLSDFPFIVLLLLGTGFYLTIRLRFMPIYRIPAAFKMLWQGRKTDGKDGEVSPFAALATALSSTVGTGNLAGVATAIAIGGPGAIFWMWMTALVGMATKYSESLLAVRFREVDANGVYKGGPTYYIKNGMGPKWKWLAILFCLGAFCSAIGAGNMVQGNGIAEVVETNLGTPRWVTGLTMALLAFVIIIGGIKSIGRVASKLVPFMGVGYVVIAFIILTLNAQHIPDAFASIFKYAFGGHAAIGGFTGAVVAQAVRAGVSRGLFSNEAGQGSAPIAHAAAQTKDPVRQANIAMLGTFIDTIVICTMTALIILSVKGDFNYNPAVRQMEFCVAQTSELSSPIEFSSGERKVILGADDAPINITKSSISDKLDQCKTALAGVDGSTFDDRAYDGLNEGLTLPTDYAWQSDYESSSITSAAFEASGFPFGGLVITFTLIIFAFTTILGWSYYGERAVAFLAGERAVLPFRVLWCIIVYFGAVLPVQAVWTMGDIGNGLMATPNLIAVLMLSGVVISMSRGGKDTRKVHKHDESEHAKGLRADS